jgi:cell filamentation protein
MYGAHEDPYVYPDTHILKNTENIKDAETLAAFELEVVNVRSKSGIPDGKIDAAHYRQIHYHLFQDIYEWAGDYRTIRIAKNGNWFCYPEHIDAQMTQLFEALKADDYLKGLTPTEFATHAAKLLADLNAIHPFRDGNGRTQLSFLSLLADNAGHRINLERINPDKFLEAMIKSFVGDMMSLKNQIHKLL